MPVERIVNGPEPKWVRSTRGIFGGVCQGLGERMGIDPWVLRLLWLFSILFIGTGLLLYIICLVSLPREDQLESAEEDKLLGICRRISHKTGTEVGLVRVATIILGLCSLGATVVGYLVLYFLMPESNGHYQGE